MNEKIPNCFVVGAPKCGTTSLYYYFSQHPEIYLSPIKEPVFFAKDIIDWHTRCKFSNPYFKLYTWLYILFWEAPFSFFDKSLSGARKSGLASSRSPQGSEEGVSPGYLEGLEGLAAALIEFGEPLVVVEPQGLDEGYHGLHD